jgi:cysteine sulfinate desulfinase/cysteine desulfurase-like protein
MQQTIYLDNNATTKVDEAVLEDMLPYLSQFYGNPSSMHTFGGQVGKAVRKARSQVAALLGAEDTEIILPVVVLRVIMLPFGLPLLPNQINDILSLLR